MRNIIPYVSLTNLRPDILIQISMSSNTYLNANNKWQIASYNQEKYMIRIKTQVRNVISFHKKSPFKYEISSVECGNHILSIHHPHHLSTIIPYDLISSISFLQCSSNSLITLYEHAYIIIIIFLYLHCPYSRCQFRCLTATWQYPHDLHEQQSWEQLHQPDVKMTVMMIESNQYLH